MNFNALSGAETKKFLLAEIEKMFDESGNFTPHLTYPWFRFELDLKITLLSGRAENPGEMKTLAVSGHVEVPKENSAIPPGSGTGPTETIEFQASGEVNTPDTAREASDQPLHIAEESETGIKVDKPRKRVKSSSAPWLKEERDGE